MKLLWIARTCPFPANDGEKLRVYNLLKNLARTHEITVVYRQIEPEEAAGAQELLRFCKAVHAVQVPRPRSLLRRAAWALPFVFSRYPISLCTVFFKPILKVVQRLAREERFDVVQVEHSSLTIYLDHMQFAHKPALVLTLHNIDYIRNERVLANTRWGVDKVYHLLNQRRFKHWELASLRRYGQVIAMSDLDRNILLRDSPGLAVAVVPNGVDASAVPYEAVDPASKTLIFVASMDSEANHDGAMFFLNEVWPLLRREGRQLVVKMVGRAPQAELLARHNGEDIVVTGKVAEVLPFYREALAAIVPLRSGGGTRLKIIEALAAGTPVVSTSVGCEGLDVANGRDILIADTPATFAAAVERLLAEPALVSALGCEGRSLVEHRYDWALVASVHDQVYQAAISARAERAA